MIKRPNRRNLSSAYAAMSEGGLTDSLMRLWQATFLVTGYIGTYMPWRCWAKKWGCQAILCGNTKPRLMIGQAVHEAH